MKKLLSIFAVCFCCLLGFVGCGFLSNPVTENETGSVEKTDAPDTPTKTDYSLDDTFVFDNLEITLGSNYSLVKMTNSFSDYYGKDIIRMPVTVKNLANDTNFLNYFFYDVYGPEGAKINIFTFDYDDNIGNAGDLLSGASYTKYLYFAYAGNGDYQFIFDRYSEKITVKFSITTGPEIIEEKSEYGLNERFIYDGLEVSATGYSFVTVDNVYSDCYGKPVVRLEFSVKNLMDTENNLDFLDMTVYDPSGVEAKGQDRYFDDSTYNVGKLAKDAAGKVALYFAYSTPGEYKVTYGLFTKELTVKFQVDGSNVPEFKTEFGLYEQFVYDGLEVTATGYSFVTVDNVFSDYFGKPIVRLEFTVKNLMDSENNLSFLDMTAYDPSGAEVKGQDSYFDDSSFNVGKLAKNASGTVAFYFAYTTSGEYKVTFGAFKKYATVLFNIEDSDVPEFKTEYGLNEQFTYDGLEITATGYSFTTVNNMFSEYNGKPVIRLEFSVKNTKDTPDTLNYFNMTAFDPSGVEVKKLDAFFDDSAVNASNLQKNASGTVAFYLAYTENGRYSIAFGSYKTYLTLVFDINR